MYKAGVHKHFTMKASGFFVVLNLLDYLTTHILLSLDGQEVMPMGDWVIRNYDMLGLYAYKLVVTAAVLVLASVLKFKDSLWSLLNGTFAGIVLWNTLGIVLSLFFPS